MPTIEDELRRVLDAYSDHAPDEPERRGHVRRRIERRRTTRTASLAAVAVAGVLAAAGGFVALTGGHPTADVAAEPSTAVSSPATVLPSTAPTTTGPTAPDVWTPPQPGALPEYWEGQKLVTSVSIDLAKTHTVTLTFTPTAWNFDPGTACYSPTNDLFLALQLNGFDNGGQGCSDGLVGPSTNGYLADSPFYSDVLDSYTQSQVTLGQPVTITGTVGVSDGGDGQIDHPLTRPVQGLVTVGIYESVPFAQYPLPPKPTGGVGPIVGPVPDQLMNLLGKVSGGSPVADVTRTVSVKLSHQIELEVVTNAPCMLSIYIDNVPLEEYDTWEWGGGSDNYGMELVGPGNGRLPNFAPGQVVTLKVVASNVVSAHSWAVALFGD